MERQGGGFYRGGDAERGFVRGNGQGSFAGRGVHGGFHPGVGENTRHGGAGGLAGGFNRRRTQRFQGNRQGGGRPFTGHGGNQIQSFGQRASHGVHANMQRPGQGVAQGLHGPSMHQGNTSAGQVTQRDGLPGIQGHQSGFVSLNLPAQAAVLIQKAFETVASNVEQGHNITHASQDQETQEQKKNASELISFKSLTKASTVEKGESSKEATGKKNPPYCYRCFTKGHEDKDCVVEAYCVVCNSKEHEKIRCPTYRAVRQNVELCGYAVEGLGFFYIPHTPKEKAKMSQNGYN